MTEITSTNSSATLKTSEQFYHSKDMVFGCSSWSAVIKRSDDNGQISEKVNNIVENKTPITSAEKALMHRLETWKSNFTASGWLLFTCLLIVFFCHFSTCLYA